MSPSAAAIIEGSTCWGHITGVVADNVRTFADRWTGTGTIELSGDAERVALAIGAYMVSELVYTDTRITRLRQNLFNPAGDNATLSYRHGATDVACLAADWELYSGTFMSLGYVQAKIEYAV